MRESIGVGIVGYGAMYSMGKHHSAEVHGTEGMALRAIFDLLPARRDAAREEQPNATVYDTYEELLADEGVDLVVLVTPHNTHCALSLQASRAGKHVMTEKVMCLTTAEADDMIEAARDAGRMLTVYQNRRWDGDFLTVQKVLQSGQLGNVFQIESCVNGFYFPDGWRGVKECGGGMLYDWGAHLCDQICTLLRPAKPVSVYAISHAGAHDVDIETQTTAMIKFDSGVSAELDVGCMSHISRPRWLIRGEKGAFVMSDWNNAVIKTADGETRIDVEKSNWRAIYQNVADHLSRGKPLAVTAKDVRSAMQVIDAAFMSADASEVVRIGGTN
jgi:predicted dehydrogenase